MNKKAKSATGAAKRVRDPAIRELRQRIRGFGREFSAEFPLRADAPGLDQLQAMIEALRADAPLDAAQRADIAETLYYLWCKVKSSRRSTPYSTTTWTQAALVQRLVDDHDLPLAEALWRVAPRGTAKDSDRIKRAYQKLRRCEQPADLMILITSTMIEEALAVKAKPA